MLSGMVASGGDRRSEITQSPVVVSARRLRR